MYELLKKIIILSTAISSFPNGSPLCDITDSVVAKGHQSPSDESLGFSLLVKPTGQNNWNISITNSVGKTDFQGLLLYVHHPSQPQTHLGQILFIDQNKWKYSKCATESIHSTVTHANPDPVKLVDFSMIWTFTNSSLSNIVVEAAIALKESNKIKWQHLRAVEVSSVNAQSLNLDTHSNTTTASVPSSVTAGLYPPSITIESMHPTSSSTSSTSKGLRTSVDTMLMVYLAFLGLR